MSGIGRKLVAALPEEHTWVGGAVRATLRTQSHNARDPMAAPGDLRRSLQSQVTIPVRRAGSTAAPAAAAAAEPAPAAEHPVMRRSASEPWRRTSSNNGRRSDAGQPPAEMQADTSVIPQQRKESVAAVGTAAADRDVLAANNVSSTTAATRSVGDASAADGGIAVEPTQIGAEGEDDSSNAGKVTAAKQGKQANRKKGHQQDKRSSVTAGAAISPFGSRDNSSNGAGTSAAELAPSAADAVPLAAPAAAADSNTLNGKSSPWGRASSMPTTTKVDGPVAAAGPGASSNTQTAASMPLKATAQTVAAARISNGGSSAAPPASTYAHSRSSSSVGAGLASALATRTSPPATPGSSSSSIVAGLATALATRTSPPTTPGGSSGGLQAYDRYSELLFRLQQFLPALKAKAAQSADFEATWEVLKVGVAHSPLQVTVLASDLFSAAGVNIKWGSCVACQRHSDLPLKFDGRKHCSAFVIRSCGYHSPSDQPTRLLIIGVSNQRVDVHESG